MSQRFESERSREVDFFRNPHITTITHAANGGDYTGISIAAVEVEVIDDELTCGDWGYFVSDINKDCYVN